MGLNKQSYSTNGTDPSPFLVFRPFLLGVVALSFRPDLGGRSRRLRGDQACSQRNRGGNVSETCELKILEDIKNVVAGSRAIVACCLSRT